MERYILDIMFYGWGCIVPILLFKTLLILCFYYCSARSLTLQAPIQYNGQMGWRVKG